MRKPFHLAKLQINPGKKKDFSTISLVECSGKFITLRHEVTKRVYFIGNERMLIAHDSNRLRFS